MPHSGKVAEAVQKGLEVGLFQRIHGVAVIPRPESVLVLFGTTQPCVPIVEVVQLRVPVTSVQIEDVLDVRFPIFAPMTTEHAFVLGSPHKPLPQGQLLQLRITAPPSRYPKLNPRSARHWVSFSTLRRSASVHIEKIHVRVDGDPLDAGELDWRFAVYDTIRRVLAAEPQFIADANAYDGKDVHADLRFAIPVAPDELRLYAKCVDNDEFAFPNPFAGLQGPGSAGKKPPETPPDAAGHGDNDYGEWTELLFTFPLPDVPGSHQQKHVVDSVWGGLSFSVHFVVETKVESPVEQAIGGLKTKVHTASTTAGLGEMAGGGGPGNGHLLAPGPDGHLLHRRLGTDLQRRSRDAWQAVGTLWASQLTTATTDGGEIHVYTLDDRGAVRRRRWPAERDPSPEQPWEKLGGRMHGTITAVPRRGGVVDLFARGRDGGCYHRAVGARSGRDSDWVRLGDWPADATLTALAAGPGSLHLILADEQGNVRHKHRDGGAWKPGRERWTEIGDDALRGPVAASAGADGGVALVVAAGEGRVFWKEWRDGRWRPDGAAWEGGVTIEEVLGDQAKAEEPAATPGRPPRTLRGSGARAALRAAAPRRAAGRR